MHSTNSLRIALLAGGDSDEREISLKSGTAVEAALTQAGHRVLHLDPAIVELSGVDWSQFDVAFIALHGSFGEDGQVQELLEKAAVPYTGSDAAASRIAFSKSAAKQKFVDCGVPTPRSVVIHKSDDLDQIRHQASEVGYPLVVKPDAQGSSLGITIVRHPADLINAVRLCFEFDGVGLIEKMIEGTEWTVGLIDRELLPAIKIETEREFYDWQAKYVDDDTRYLFDAAVSSHVIEKIQATGLAACSAIGTQGMARVDIRLDHEGQPWVLEVNTIPGMTDHSLIPKAAAHKGISFPELCDRLAQDSLRPQPPAPHLFQVANRQIIGK